MLYYKGVPWTVVLLRARCAPPGELQRHAPRLPRRGPRARGLARVVLPRLRLRRCEPGLDGRRGARDGDAGDAR